jgi:hypothetical protein
MVSGCGHDVARHLKEKGVDLAALIDATMQSDETSRLMAEVPFIELHGRSRIDAWRLDGQITRVRLSERWNRFRGNSREKFSPEHAADTQGVTRR